MATEKSKTELTGEFKIDPAKVIKFGPMTPMPPMNTVHHVSISIPEIPEVDGKKVKLTPFQSTMMRTIIQQNKAINFNLKMLFCAVMMVGLTTIIPNFMDSLKAFINVHCKA